MRNPPIKLLIILTLSVVFAGVFTTTTHALYIDEDGATWYTVPEMLEYKDITDQEEQKLCGEDINCKQELFFSKIETDEKFRALEQLTEQQIVVTSVNPAKETLKVLFFDEEMMLKRMGISEKIELGEFYMGWFDNDVERIYNYGSYTEELFADTMPGAHYIYAQFDNYGNKIPANQEIEISAPGSNLNLNTSGEIAYSAFADHFNAVGRFIYTSCLTEPDYVEGTECRLMLSGEKGFKYLPPRETSTSPSSTDYNETEDNLSDSNIGNSDTLENDIETNSDDTNNTSSQRDDEATEKQSEIHPTSITTNVNRVGNDTDKDVTTNSFNNHSSSQEISTKTTISESESLPRAPETGASISSEENTTEFPWWLKVFIGLSVAILLWLFWPSRKKTSKTSKKVKKVVDKKYYLR